MNANDLDTLARTLYGEAEANDPEDAYAIAAVVRNRMAYPNWPDTAAAVCTQPYQFSCWNPSDPNRARIMAASGTPGEPGYSDWFRTCTEIARQALAGEPEFDPTSGATHYHTNYIRVPKWAKGHEPCYVTAQGKYQHLFYNDIDTPAPRNAKAALDQTRPLSASRTMIGATTASVGTAGVSAMPAITEIAEAVDQAKDTVGGLMVYVDSLKWVFIALTIVGLGLVIYARIHDRQTGKR